MDFARRRPATFFLIAAVVITYVLGPLAFLALRALQRGLGSSVPGVNDVLMRFGPSLAGLLTVRLIDGAQGVRELWHRLLRWRFPVPLYLFAVLLPPALLVCVLLARGQASELAGVPLSLALQVFATQLVLASAFGGGLGEEIGWRGFLLPRLSRKRGPLAASVLVAVAWLAWHLPAYLFFGKGDDDPLLPFAVIVFPFSVALTFILLRSGDSLLAPVLLHGSINAAFYSVLELAPVAAARPDFQPAFDWALAGCWSVVAIAIVALAGSRLGLNKRPLTA